MKNKRFDIYADVIISVIWQNQGKQTHFIGKYWIKPENSRNSVHAVSHGWTSTCTVIITLVVVAECSITWGLHDLAIIRHAVVHGYRKHYYIRGIIATKSTLENITAFLVRCPHCWLYIWYWNTCTMHACLYGKFSLGDMWQLKIHPVYSVYIYMLYSLEWFIWIVHERRAFIVNHEAKPSGLN